MAAFMSRSITLSPDVFARGLAELCTRDPDLATLHTRLGAPPLWARTPGFATLIHIILEQQVSLASARATFDRLQATVDPLTPAGLLALEDADLKRIGFSRQKSIYARHLAQALESGSLDLAALREQEDGQVREALTAIKGIGPWTAEIYLLMALHRADAWPAGDLALQVAAREVKQLPARPTADELTELAEAWRPWRAVAARQLWRHYLSRAGSSDRG